MSEIEFAFERRDEVRGDDELDAARLSDAERDGVCLFMHISAHPLVLG